MSPFAPKDELKPNAVEYMTDSRSSDIPQKPSHGRMLRLVFAALVILGLVFGARYYRHSLSHESTDDAFIDGHIIPISPRVSGHVAKVYVSDNEWVRSGDLLVELDPRDFQAQLDAAQAALDSAKAADQAKSVEVELTTISTTAVLSEAGAAVEAGKAAVEAAEAQAATAAGERDRAKAQVSSALAAMDQAEAEVDSAVARHERDSADMKRDRELASSRSVSAKDLDHAIATERMSAADLRVAKKKIETQRSMIIQAEATLKAAEETLRQAEAQISLRRAQLDQANARLSSAQSAPQRIKQSRAQADMSRADMEKAEAEAAQAGLNLTYTKIHAPADGFVTKKGVEPGTFVQAGQSLLAIVPKKVWVTANFKETQLTRMHPGQRVEIKVDAYPGIRLEGHVESIQRGTGSRFSLLPPENATGNYVKVVQRVPVKIVLEQAGKGPKVVLVPGMSVVPEVDLQATVNRNEEKKGTQSKAFADESESGR